MLINFNNEFQILKKFSNNLLCSRFIHLIADFFFKSPCYLINDDNMFNCLIIQLYS